MSLLEKMKSALGMETENDKILAEIRELPDDTEKLDLRDRPLTSLAGVKLPSGLKWLDLSFTKISSLKEVTFPDGLEYLDLAYIPLTSLKDVVFPDSLEELWLQGVKFTDLNGVKLPKKLRKLFISHTNLITLRGIAFPENLKKLNLRYTPLQDLEGVNLLQSLEVLLLDHTKLTKIPSGIKHLKNLYYINLSGLHLTELPDWLPDLGLPFTREASLTDIVLKDTTVEGVDMSIFDQSQETILEWFKEYTKKKQQKTQPIGIDLGNSYSGSLEKEPEDIPEPEHTGISDYIL